MLDKQSEKLLKLTTSKYNGVAGADVRVYSKEMDIHYTELNELCLNLKNKGYVNSFYASYDQEEPVELCLTYEGIHYLDLKKKETLSFFLKSIWVPIIVSLLTNLIISLSKWLLPLILQLLFHSP